MIVTILPDTQFPIEMLLSKSTRGSAGYDIVYQGELLIIPVGKQVLVPTGLYLSVPLGYEIQVRPRSSLASKGIIIPNSPGTIDSDYKQEIKVLFLNLGNQDLHLQKSDKICQLVFSRIIDIDFVNDGKFIPKYKYTREQDRTGGFGSTGR